MNTKMVHELQKIAAESKLKTSEILRQAYLVAVKLQLTDIKNWLKLEMHGYSAEDTDVPKYRQVKCSTGSQNTPDTHGTVILRESIDQLEQRTKLGGSWITLNNSDIIRNKNNGIIITTKEIIVDTEQIELALKGLNNVILEWAAELESVGIVIENMTATKSEIEKSKTVVTNVYATNVQYNYAEYDSD